MYEWPITIDNGVRMHCGAGDGQDGGGQRVKNWDSYNRINKNEQTKF